MYFFTETINSWQPLLLDDKLKVVILDAFNWFHTNNKSAIHAFVIMPNHFHVIMSPLNNFLQADNETALLSFTGHAFKKYLKENNVQLLQNYKSTQADRSFHFWERRSHTIELMSRKIVEQKIDYIHDNPCQPKWNLASHPILYKYSSAKFYQTNVDDFGFLSSYTELS